MSIIRIPRSTELFMILPIHLLGSPVLREEAQDIEVNTSELQDFIDDMFETLGAAKGIGLAAPQVGRSQRLFVVDLRPMAKEFEEEYGSVPKWAREPLVFINPQIVEVSEAEITFEEGCLSIPEIREEVSRPEAIRIEYLDRNFEPQKLEADEFLARVIQHEYDHIEGILFFDHLSPLKRRLLQRRLRAITNGEVEAEYPTVHSK